VSPRQYTMMKLVIDYGGIELEEAQIYKQNTLGSCAYRQWLKRSGHRLVPTDAGRQEFFRYGSDPINRKESSYSAALSKWIRGEK
jgi:hypothetical protein